MLKLISKTLLFSTALVSMFMLNSCKEDVIEEPIDEVVVDDDYYEYQDFNLSDYEIPAVIKLPDETANIGASTKPEIIHSSGDIYWTINVGQNFQMVIEDFAQINDLVKVEKKELQETEFYKIKYLVEDEDMIVYERTLLVDGKADASPKVGVEHRSYHVYAQKTINGITYKFASRPEGFEKMIIELMAKSIKSIKPVQ